MKPPSVPKDEATDGAEQPMAEVFEILNAAQALDPVVLSQGTPPSLAMRAMRMMGRVDDKAFGVVSFDGSTAWERHPGDEFLYYLEGEAELFIIVDGKEARRVVKAGEAALVPRRLWHRQRAIRPVRLLFITPGAGTESALLKPGPAASEAPSG